MRVITLLAASLAVVAVADVNAQDRSRAERERVERERRPLVYSYSTSDDPDRAFLGVSTSPSGVRDTLGLLITSITPGGPAEKAGLEEGNRIASINGVSLRLSRADAEDPEIPGLMQRRLVRELAKVKPGDEVALRVYAGGTFREMKVKTGEVPYAEGYSRVTRAELEDRAVVGLNVTSTGTRRDTLGLFVTRVTPDGPAEKAGIVEGDRISAINGVDMRVAREDAGDRWVSGTKSSRFTRELRKLKAGDAVELRVHSSVGGAPRTVRVTTVRAADLRAEAWGGMGVFGGEGFEFVTPPALPAMPARPAMPRVAPRVYTPAPGRIQIHTLDDDDLASVYIDGEGIAEMVGDIVGDVVGTVVPGVLDGVLPMVETVVPSVIEGVLPAIESIGPALERAFDDVGPELELRLRDLERSLREARRSRQRMKIEQPAAPAKKQEWIKAD